MAELSTNVSLVPVLMAIILLTNAVATFATNQVTSNRNSYIINSVLNYFELSMTDQPPVKYTPDPLLTFTQIDKDELHQVGEESERTVFAGNATLQAQANTNTVQPSTTQMQAQANMNATQTQTQANMNADNQNTIQAQAIQQPSQPKTDIPPADLDSGIPHTYDFDDKVHKKYHTLIRYKIKPSEK